MCLKDSGEPLAKIPEGDGSSLAIPRAHYLNSTAIAEVIFQSSGLSSQNFPCNPVSSDHPHLLVPCFLSPWLCWPHKASSGIEFVV